MKTKKVFRRLAQSTTEYAVLVAVIVTALVAMQVYLKRGIQGRIKDLSSQLAPDGNSGALQYEAGNTDALYTTEQKGTTIQQYFPGGRVVTQMPAEIIIRKGQETVFPAEGGKVKGDADY
ncbi:MAG: hypothetical protein ABIH18_08170 [Candidatus Omnitrophota bacterium]